MKRVLAALLLCVPACRAPAPAPPPADAMPDALAWPGPALKHARTPSGMMVALHDPGPGEPAFSLSLVLTFGSAHDPRDAHGAALGASVMFVHAGVHDDTLPATLASGRALTTWLQSRGVDRHAEAFPEHVVFSMHGPAALAPGATRMLCRLVFEPQVDAEDAQDIVNDVAQMDEERAAGNASLAQEALTHALFPDHPLGRPAVPAVDAIPDALHLRAFLRSAASDPSRTLLLAATTDAAGVLDAARACSTAFPMDPPLDIAVPGPRPDGPRRLGLVASQEGTVFIRLGGRAPAPGTPELAALQVALETLANGFSSTLVTELRTRRGLVYGVEGGVLGTRSAATWHVATSTSDANAAEVVGVMLAALEGIHARGLPPAEFKRMARASALGFAQGADSLEGLMALESEHFRLGRAPGASWRTPRLWWEMDEGWGARTAGTWLDPASSVLVVVASEAALEGPLKDGLDEIIDVDDWPPR